MGIKNLRSANLLKKNSFGLLLFVYYSIIEIFLSIIVQIMRFKIETNDAGKHQDICNSVAWMSSNQLVSVGEDNTMVKWNINTKETSKFLDLQGSGLDLDWTPMTKGVSQLVAVGFADGSFKLFTRNGRLEKNEPNAHKGAIISLKWSYDGGALATAGEDGAIKIWSKSGNIRSNLLQTNNPIYCVVWGPENDSVLYCSDKNIFIKSLNNTSKHLQWKAHEGIVLKADWNPSSNLIVSVGEDCRYKVWDAYGRLLYSSSPYDYVITSIAWSPNGEYFAVGAYQMFKLCDKTGWTYSFHKTEIGSIFNIKWSADGTVCAAAGGNGTLIGEVVDRQIAYKNWEVNLNDENMIQVTDIINEINEELSFKDRVVNMSMSYSDLIITTASQCYIYNSSSWNTPHIFDLKDSVSLIIQSPKYFCLVESSNGLMIYNYEGKHISNPKIPGAKFEYLNRRKIGLSLDLLAVIDTVNSKVIKFFQLSTGKPLSFSIQHTIEIQEIALNQTEQTGERKIAFIDANRDLFLSPVHKKDIAKICTICDSFIWHDRFDILSAVSDGKLNTYYYPNVFYLDKELAELCVSSKDAPQIGRLSQMITFTDSQVTIRRKDGGLVNFGVSPYPSILLDFTEKAKWSKAIKICRFVKEPILWACLAAISMKAQQLPTAEIAFATIQQADKVQFLSEIQQLPSQIMKNAALALFFKRTQEAEQIYVQNKLFYRAIKMNINLFKWERALELAQTHKVHLDTVAAYRRKYLERIGKEESEKRFLKLNAEVGETNWETIKEKINKEKEREKTLR